ncbi:MAG TPA: VWA domain-containing protein, partial [Bryobacteraceae bacterium]
VAHDGLQELRPGDRVSVMVFSTEARVVAPFSADFREVEEAIHRVLSLDFGGGTRIQDSIYAASHCFLRDKAQEHRRRAVLVVTDDFGRPSHRKTSIVENLWEADAVVCGLVVPNPAVRILAPLSGAVPGRIGGMEDLVEKTGGDIIHSGHLEKTFPEMMHRIRSRYTLYYRLPEGEVGSLRTIDVQLSERGRRHYPRARVVAQRGYRLQGRDRYGFATRELNHQ